MFSHEGLGLITLFIVLLLAVLAMFIHPVHAFWNWLQRRKRRLSNDGKAVERKPCSR
ncbi:putative iron-regulated membrane protein [Pseudomonas fluorescens]